MFADPTSSIRYRSKAIHPLLLVVGMRHPHIKTWSDLHFANLKALRNAAFEITEFYFRRGAQRKQIMGHARKASMDDFIVHGIHEYMTKIFLQQRFELFGGLAVDMSFLAEGRCIELRL